MKESPERAFLSTEWKVKVIPCSGGGGDGVWGGEDKTGSRTRPTV